MAHAETPRTFGELLDAELRERDLSQRALAKLLAEASGRNIEVERRAIGKWLKSVNGPNDENRGRIAAALELRPDHPIIRDRPRAAVLGVLGELEARVARLEERVDDLSGQGGPPAPRVADG